MPVSAETYERVALEDGDEQWELDCGRLRKKPLMTTEHQSSMDLLAGQCYRQLDPSEYRIRVNSGRLRISTGTFYVPDLCVIPTAMVLRLKERPGTFEVYTDAVPFVVEIWSPSTGEYDVDTKLLEYQWRGDAEIWRPHPYEHTVVAWRRGADVSYTETILTGGIVQLAALPHVSIDIEAIFA